MGSGVRQTITCEQCIQEWETQQKEKREKAQKRVLEGRDPDESTEGEDSDDEQLPFACFICRLYALGRSFLTACACCESLWPCHMQIKRLSLCQHSSCAV